MGMAAVGGPLMRHTLLMDEHPAVASVSLAAILESSVTHPQIGEWLSSPTRDIHARLAQFSQPFDGPGPGSLSSGPSKPRSQRSSSSMAPACIHQPSDTSTHPPSLYNYSEATPTETSISTGIASRFSGVPLLEERNGVLERTENDIRHPTYECSFHFLACNYITQDPQEWRIHCLSHWRGEEPPKVAQCPLCEFIFPSDSGFYSWDRRMDHVELHHSVLGETLRTSRPDFNMFHHLWQKRLIDDQDLKELMGGNHNLTRTPLNYTLTNNSRRARNGRDGRGQQRQHIGARRPTGAPFR